MNNEVRFWDSDHGLSLLNRKNYFDQPGGHTFPTKVRLLSPFEHLIEFGIAGFPLKVGDGFADGSDDLLELSTGIAFLEVVAEPSLFEEMRFISIFVTPLSLDIGIKNFAMSPVIFPANLLPPE
jgi:hypothetical protein